MSGTTTPQEVTRVSSHNSPVTQREKYIETCVPLSQACINGDWRLAEELINQNPKILEEPISIIQGTAIHLAAAFNQKAFVEKLFVKSPPDSDTFTREDSWGTTAFGIAAITGNIDILKMFVRESPATVTVKGFKNLFPVELAARCGHHKAASYLYGETNFSNLTESDLGNIFLTFTETEMFDIALEILEKNKGLATFVRSTGDSALFIMAMKPHAIASHNELRWYERVFRTTIFSKTQVRAQGRQLLENLWSSVINLPDEQFWRHLSTPREIIFEAAKRGNVEFLLTAFRTYPDLIYIRDEEQLTVFHIAAAWRHETLFRTIYQLGALKEYLVNMIDINGNTMLHLVASRASGEMLSTVSGAALQMQHEVLWFKAVEQLSPKQFQNLRNNEEEKLTPHEIFVRDHKILREQGEKWLKETSSSCMLVAALITTVIFATVFTVPGGTDENTGLPKLGQKSAFVVFIMSAGTGLSTSFASLLIFLSIITSRYNYSDFKANLPLKLMFGMISLYASIISMIVSFISTLIVIRGGSPRWRIGFIATLGFLTALLYIGLHSKLWLITFHSAFKSMRLFSRKGSRKLFH